MPRLAEVSGRLRMPWVVDGDITYLHHVPGSHLYGPSTTHPGIVRQHHGPGIARSMAYLFPAVSWCRCAASACRHIEPPPMQQAHG